MEMYNALQRAVVFSHCVAFFYSWHASPVQWHSMKASSATSCAEITKITASANQKPWLSRSSQD